MQGLSALHIFFVHPKRACVHPKRVCVYPGSSLFIWLNETIRFECTFGVARYNPTKQFWLIKHLEWLPLIVAWSGYNVFIADKVNNLKAVRLLTFQP